MAATKYSYNISTDFPNQKVSPDRLTLEVAASAIATALSYIETSGNDCDIWFVDALSAGDQTILDGVVAAHSGDPIIHQTETYAESLSGSSTTATGWQTKVDLATDSTLVAGTYRISWYCEINGDGITYSCKSRVQVDGSTVLADVNMEMKDAENYFPFSGIAHTELTSDVHNITLQYCSESSNNTVTIRNARVDLWRVENA